MNRESWVEAEIRKARERGDFDALPGHGKPLADVNGVEDALWWVKKLIERENLEVPLPPTLAVRKARDDALAQIAEAHDESIVRTIVAELNVEIRKVNRLATEGPPSTVMPLDVDDVVARWRQQRAG
jgi:hypothetical protein